MMVLRLVRQGEKRAAFYLQIKSYAKLAPAPRDPEASPIAAAPPRTDRSPSPPRRSGFPRSRPWGCAPACRILPASTAAALCPRRPIPAPASLLIQCVCQQLRIVVCHGCAPNDRFQVRISRQAFGVGSYQAMLARQRKRTISIHFSFCLSLKQVGNLRNFLFPDGYFWTSLGADWKATKAPRISAIFGQAPGSGVCGLSSLLLGCRPAHQERRQVG